MVKIGKILAFGIIIIITSCHSRQGKSQIQFSEGLQLVSYDQVLSGAERTGLYFPELKGKSIGVVCNQTSLIENTLIVDSLINSGFNVKVIFSPEHGFRGDFDAGAEIRGIIMYRNGIKVISLYNKNKKPLPADLEGIDVLLFDIQDVGVRFYTYISTLTLVMEAAAEQGIPIILTDRPNPNGFYIDGPVLDTAFRSFVGMHPVPIVYGMTIGEYALMINGEGWLAEKKCDLKVVPMTGYTHNLIVQLKEKPSPNLPTWQSIYLYPSLCMFEGTIISIGRGTDAPFQVIGHPGYMPGGYVFTPKAIPGVSENPPYKDQECYGLNLTAFAENFPKNEHHFTLWNLISMYEFFNDSTEFFTPYFDKLAGNNQLRKDILGGLTEEEIRNSWKKDLAAFMQIRKKYLLYED